MTIIRDTVSAVLLLGTAIIVGSIIAATVAHDAPACLSKREARAAWPRSHLYRYHGCWSTRYARYKYRRAIEKDEGDTDSNDTAREGSVRRGILASAPGRGGDASERSDTGHNESKAGSTIKFSENTRPISPSVVYPSTIRRRIMSIDPSFLYQVPSTLSYRLLDIDEMTGPTMDLPDCCWPDLAQDANGNWVLK